MNREEIITEITRKIEAGERVYSRKTARSILDFLDDIGYDPCYELGINIHNHQEGQWCEQYHCPQPSKHVTLVEIK